MAQVSVTRLGRAPRGNERLLKRAGERICALLGKKSATFDVYLVDERTMQHLNFAFRKKRGVTNVLSFPENGNFPFPGTKGVYRGELYLTPSYIKRQAEQRIYGETDSRTLLLYLFIHSILHLFGYSHGRKRDRIKMETKEQELLLRLHVSHRHRS